MRFLPDSPPGDRRSPDRKPPQRAERLLAAHLGSNARAEFILGDLREEYEAHRARRPRRWSDAWYWLAVLALWLRLPRGGGRRPGARQVESIFQDLRFGVRSLRKSWPYTVTAGLTLAIGIGATTAVFSVSDRILFRPLPYPVPDRLAVIETNTGGPGWYGSSQPEFMDFQAGLDSFERLGMWGAVQATLADSSTARRVRIGLVSSEVLPLLGVQPEIGRFPSPEEDLPGGPQVAVISHALWQQAFGGDPGVLGESVGFFGDSWTVVGVMTAGFAFPEPDLAAWLPYRLDPANPVSRSNHNFRVVGRLRGGVTLESARAELELHTERIRSRYPESYAVRGYRTRLQSLHESTVGETRTGLLLLLGGSVLVLIVASVNVSNLALARGDARRAELAVREALGAGRGRVARLLLIESALVALAGGGIGLVLGWLGIAGMVAIAPDSLPRVEQLGMGGTAVVASVALMIVSLVLFGIGPAVTGVRRDLRAVLGSGRGSSGRRSRRARRVLVVSQLSLAGLLAIASASMIRTLANLYDVDLGFRPEHALTFDVSPSPVRYETQEDGVALYERIIPRLRALPGVVAAGAHAATPLGRQRGNLSILTEEAPNLDISAAPDAYMQVATPGYFDAMGLTLRSGRTFTEADRADAPPVVVINETLARLLWPGEDPIGHRFRMFAEGWPFMEVIGVVGDVRHTAPDQLPEPRFYAPHAQAWRTAYFSPLEMSITLRAEGDPERLAAAARAAIAEIDPTAPVSDMRSMTERIADSVSDRRFVSGLLEAFGLVALLLAAVGVYGVMSLAVRERDRELGLRKALGAPGGSLVRMVLGEALLLAGLGASLAIAGGIALGWLIRGLLFGVAPSDPLTLVIAGATLTAAAAGAAVLPAARASRVDPIEALRSEG